MAATTTVHFATNREEVLEGGATFGFGPRLNPKSPLWLRHGAADMRGPSRKDGSFSAAALRVAPESIPGVTADPKAPAVLGSSEVFEGLRERLIANQADLALMIHGYACHFANALSNAAQIKTRWGTKAHPPETAISPGPRMARWCPGSATPPTATTRAPRPRRWRARCTG